MTREERLAAIRRDVNARMAIGMRSAEDPAWLLARLDERDRGFDLATARIARLEAALRDAKLPVAETHPDALIWTPVRLLHARNADIDAALRGD